jgi:hypothetical protein
VGTREAVTSAEAERVNAPPSEASLTREVTEVVEEGYSTTAEIKAFMAGRGFAAKQVLRALSGARRNGWLVCERYGSTNASWARTERPLVGVGRPKDTDFLNEQADWRQRARTSDEQFAALIGDARFEDVKFKPRAMQWRS